MPIREQSSTMALTENNVTDNSSFLLSPLSNRQQASTFNLFDDSSLNYFSLLTPTMNLSDITTLKISDSNHNNNDHISDDDFAALFVSSMLQTTSNSSFDNINNNNNNNNNNNDSSTNTIDDVFLNQVTDLNYCSSPIIDKQQTIGPPPGFEKFPFNSSSTSDLLVSKTTNNNPTISSISNGAYETSVSSSDTINFSQLLKSTNVDPQQQQQQSIVGNVGNIRSLSPSSHSPFTSDEQSLFFPMSTQSYSSSSSSSSSILHATSQIFSTNTPSLSTTTTTTIIKPNSAAKPHILNSLSLYNNNHLSSSSSSSLITCNTIDSPLLSTTFDNDKKMTTDKRITPSHMFSSTNSFFTNEPADFTSSKSTNNTISTTNHQSSVTARTSSSSTSSSTSSSIDEALIQLTQQQQQQQTPNVNKLFNDEPISIFNYSSMQPKPTIDKQQQAVHDNINFLASMATASTPMTSESTWQQQIPSTSISLDSSMNLKRKMRPVMLQQQQQQMKLSQSILRNNSANMHELIENLNELCYKGFDELNALIQEQRWVQSYVNTSASSIQSPSSPSSSLNGTNCCSSRILIVPEYFIFKCKKVEINASHVFDLLATGRAELRLRDLMFVFKSWKKNILNAEIIHQDEENKLRLSTEHPQSYYMTDAVLKSVFDRVSHAIHDLCIITQKARAAFQYATLNIYQASSRQQQVSSQLSSTIQSPSPSSSIAFAQLQAMRQQK
ncbi:unnamed protein product [Rotaria magnacalcarata]|uniref:Uncharacterized protein n=3 Tax=Rotaria magnacalcarata TaxID=392030 RepID=A0A819IDP6_9BILA|nr:unnamed protein product [Rotaria magnacalcarata]CAF3911328.1 unnamed protein product [Rotaria magnacalcarata]